jgi:hypothetical protein
VQTCKSGTQAPQLPLMPQLSLSCLSKGRQVSLFWQQPSSPHDEAVQMHDAPLQVSPGAQALHVVPRPQTAVPEPVVRQSSVPGSQQPPGHNAVSHLHSPLVHRCAFWQPWHVSPPLPQRVVFWLA